VVWRKRELPDQTEEEAPLIPRALIPAKLKAKR